MMSRSWSDAWVLFRCMSDTPDPVAEPDEPEQPETPDDD